MKLLYIHGIGQGDTTKPALETKWGGLLTAHGLPQAKLDASHAEMAFYGDILKRWTAQGGIGALPMGSPVPDGEMHFMADFLDEVAVEFDLDDDAITTVAMSTAAESGAAAIAQSTWLGRRAVAILSLLENSSKLHGAALAPFIREAYTYLANPGARHEIDQHVRAMVPDGDVVIVAHSLGTIVAYTALRDFQLTRPGVKVPLLITAGSPLGAHQVKARIGPPWAVPGNVADWSNYYDTGDPVTLGRALAQYFAAGIADHVVNNQTTNGHSIEGYLDEAGIVAQLNAVL